MGDIKNMLRQTFGDYESYLGTNMENLKTDSQWDQKYGKMLKAAGITIDDLMKGCTCTDKASGNGMPLFKVGESTARKFFKQAPAKRHNAICIGLMLGLNTDEINDMLKNYCHVEGLYAKNPEDAVWIYIIESKKDRIMEPADYFVAYYKTYKNYVKEYDENSSVRTAVQTNIMMRELLELAKDADPMRFNAWLQNNVKSFMKCRERLRDYMKEEMSKRSLSAAVLTTDYLKNEYERFRTEIDFHPSRSFLIAFAMHLGMTLEQTDELLDKAGMAKLYDDDSDTLSTQDIADGFISMLIYQAHKRYPSAFLKNESEEYSSEKLLPLADIRTAMDIFSKSSAGEVLYDYADRLDDSKMFMADYIYNVLLESNIVENVSAERKKELKDLIDYLMLD